MTPIVLIDLSGIVYSLYHLSGDQPDTNWTSTQAVARVRELVNGAAHVGICCDAGRSFRKDLDAKYKANRPEKDEALRFQLVRSEDTLRAEGFAVLKADGFEADDIIATVCKWATENEHRVEIHSADKDLLQLVSDNSGVVVFSTRNGQTRYDEAAVFTKFKVLPAQMRDYLALVGDSSDNIKGAPGIGPVKAADLLNTYGDLDAIAQAVAENRITGTTRTILTENGLSVERARRLVTLRTDVPVDPSAILQERTPQPMEADSMTDLIDQMSEPEVVTDGPKDNPGTAPAPLSATNEPKADSEAVIEAKLAVEPYTGAWDKALEPRSARDTFIVSRALFASKLFAGYGNPQAVASIIFAGRELGLGMMGSLRGFHSVKGRVCMAADLMRGLVMASPKCEYFQCTERTPDSATWVTKRKGDPEPTRLTYTFVEAQRAGLVSPNSGWEKHPADMVAKTASSKLCRLVYADLTFGLMSAAELGGDEDI